MSSMWIRRRWLLKKLADGSIWHRMNDAFQPGSIYYVASSVMIACAIIYLLVSMDLHPG